MGSADPILVFKQHFKREEADRIVASIIQHQLVWKRLEDEKFLNELIAAFSNNKNLWTAAHICLYASGYAPQDFENITDLKEKLLKGGNTDLRSNRQAKPTIDQITSYAAGILEERQSGKDWPQVIGSMDDSGEMLKDIHGVYGTAFSIVYLLTEDRSGLIKALGNSPETQYQELLAFLIGCNPGIINPVSSEISSWLCELPVRKVNQITEALSEYAEKSLISQLTDAYLSHNPIAQNLEKSQSNTSETDELIENIKQYKEYALLARFASDSQLSEEYSQKASRYSGQLNQSLEKLSSNLQSKQKPGEKTPENLVGEIASLSDLLGSGHPAVILLRIVEIKGSDFDTALKLAKDVQKTIIQSSSIRQIIPTVESANILNAEQIVELFLDMGMIIEAMQIAEKLIELQPRNFGLIQLSARLFFDYGDHEKAIEYLTRFSLSKDLTREEELLIIEAYSNLGLWKNALNIWNDINLVSLEDYQRKAICAYRANDPKVFQETEEACKSFYQADGIFGVIRGLFSLRSGQHSAAQAEIEAVLSNRKRDRFTIQYLIEYYLAVSQPENALSWINSLSSLEKDYPEVRMLQYKIFRQTGNMEGCSQIISSFEKQNNDVPLTVLENLLEECIAQEKKQDAERILEKYSAKWPLSPNLIGYKAHLMIDSGKYNAAQDLLIDLIQRKTILEDWVVDYALSKIERKHTTFPLADSTLEIDSAQTLYDFEKKIFEQYPQNLYLQVVAAELDKKDRLSAYQDILADKRTHHHPEIWRVHAGMGKHYFQNQKYDMALVSFKEARKQQPHLKVISLYLINALAKMKLDDDALDILSASVKGKQFSLQEMLEISTNMKHSDQWLRVLQDMSVEVPDSVTLKIVLAQLYVEKNNNEKARDIISKIKFMKDSELLERLICTQILIRAGYPQEAKHMLEFLLTSRKDIRSNESLAGAFLYMQMQEYHKAANLLNLIEKSGYIEYALKSDLYKSLGLAKECDLSIQTAIKKLDEGDYGWTNNLIPWITKPVIWETIKTDKVWVYLRSIEASLQNKDYEGALEKAWQYIEKYPSDLRLSSMVLNIINLFGDGKKSEELLDKLPEDLSGCMISDSLCVYGELALRKGHEIMAANLVSQCLERIPDYPRVQALQARLLARNGNCADAKHLINEILEEVSKEEAQEGDVLGNCQLWLAEAALDLNKEKEALRVCGNIFLEYGISPECARVFLASLLKLASENWINKKLDVTQHLKEISSQDLKLFDDICIITEENIESLPELYGLAASVKIWQDLLKGKTEIAFNAASHGIDTNALMAAKFITNDQNNIGISIENSDPDEQNKFLMALLLMESQPEKAVEYISDLIRVSKNDPRYYATLAFIKKGMGRYDDAYAAISLALAEWEDEYKWQILAGELSQALGDMHASLAHYQKAAEIHKDEETQSYLGKINYQAGNRFGISFLENKLTGGRDDLETLVNLGELSIKNGKFQKAAKYLEKAIKIAPQDARSYVLLSEVALKVGNINKAEEIIEQARQINSSEIDITLQKIAIEDSKNGAKGALDWIEVNVEESTRNAWQIVVRKADLLADVQGNQAAMQFLQKQKEKHTNTALDLGIARLYLEEGDLVRAEEAAEQVLYADSNNPTAMSLLSKIFTQSGDLDKALDFLVKAIQMNPFAVDFYIELARIYQTRRELDLAADVLQNGLRSNPMNFDLLFALGLLYYQQGFYKRSEEYLKQAATIDQSNENVKRLLSTLMNANIIQPENMNANAMRMN